LHLDATQSHQTILQATLARQPSRQRPVAVIARERQLFGLPATEYERDDRDSVPFPGTHPQAGQPTIEKKVHYSFIMRFRIIWIRFDMQNRTSIVNRDVRNICKNTRGGNWNIAHAEHEKRKL